ncbi:hypothetical protein LX24_01475 [Desulfallas thermosapovorans DSM 6562]|uniref:Uncharacterized protein n=1 Tax=Desulfallas thermosapovorans DSM 6562 TaxID=1121431 RepID=A0A5S4ZRH1_9FIRM|nr:hypothetical protein LX24_01475 [Desulfallas thermosapovorans DSM 6562]
MEEVVGMSRPGGINFDTDDANFNVLRINLSNKTAFLLENITNYVKKKYPQLNRATGSWYINYGFDKRIIFF